MNYGEHSGDYKFREVAANWLSGQINLSVDKDNLFVSNGNSQALCMILDSLFNHGDEFFIEAPTYHIARAAFDERKMTVRNILKQANKYLKK